MKGKEKSGAPLEAGAHMLHLSFQKVPSRSAALYASKKH